MITADEARILGKSGNSLAYEVSKVENKIILFAAAKQVEVYIVPSFQEKVIAILKENKFEVEKTSDFTLLIFWK